MTMLTKRQLRWAVVNFTVIAFFVAGNLQNTAWMLNIAVFMLWITAIIGTIAAFIPEIFVESIVESGEAESFRSIPKHIDQTYDIIVTLIIISFGYTFLGVVYLFHIIGLSILDDKLKEYNEENKKT